MNQTSKIQEIDMSKNNITRFFAGISVISATMLVSYRHEIVTALDSHMFVRAGVAGIAALIFWAALNRLIYRNQTHADSQKITE